ncbi:MAG: HypC/HybG/HupF family hydrogenase formation chaperone [Ktedonobacterales bacterium]
MCLGIPGQLLETPDAATHMVAVRVSGARRRVDVSLLDDTIVEPGEWVLVHAGLAVTKISEQEAQETLALLQEMSDAFLGEDAAIDAPPNFAARQVDQP